MTDETFFYAIVCAPLYIGGLIGLCVIVAPGAVLKWRAKILKNKQRGRVEAWVERHLRADGPEPWENREQSETKEQVPLRPPVNLINMVEIVKLNY